MAAACLAGAAMFLTVSCGGNETDRSLIIEEEDNSRIVNLFSPMEKTEANVDNVARSATDKTVIMAEDELGISVGYITYTTLQLFD